MSRTKGKREAGGRRSGDLYEEEKHSSGGWSGGKKALAAVLCLLAVLVLAGAGWWFLFVRAPDVKDNDRPLVNSNNPNRKPEEDGDGEQVLTGRKEDYFTFLLLGKDTSSGSTDTIILVSYDVVNQAVNCMSIPRDTMVNVGWDIKRVNSVYSAKESSGGGMEGLKKQVAYLTGVMPDFHVIIEWKAVGKLVEALGGVYFDVPYDMNYDDPVGNLSIHIKAGYQLLDGSKAEGVMRCRNCYPSADIGRTATQRAFLTALAKQAITPSNVTNVTSLINTFSQYVVSDMPLNDMVFFGTQAIGMDLDSALNAASLEGEWISPYWHLDDEAVLELVNSLGIYEETVPAQALHIVHP